MEFRNYNANPKGWKTGDCVVRAIAKATGQTWEDVYFSLCKIGAKKCRMPNDKKVYETYLEDLGWVKHKQPRTDDGRKYTVKEFLDGYMYGTANQYVIFTMASHMSCAYFTEYGEEPELIDIWKCSYKCVSNYWTH